jgi:hypothetical protein
MSLGDGLAAVLNFCKFYLKYFVFTLAKINFATTGCLMTESITAVIQNTYRKFVNSVGLLVHTFPLHILGCLMTQNQLL